MRTLENAEFVAVFGGDEVEFDGNLLGCVTAVGAAGALAGPLGGPTAASTASVLGATSVVVCQMTTSAIGAEIGSAAAEFAESYDAYMDELEFALARFSQILTFGTP